MNEVSYAQVAQEGLFTKKKTVDDLLAKAQKKVTKLKTVEDVNAKLQAVDESGKAVNTALRQMNDAAKKLSAGKISDTDFKTAIKDASKSVSGPIKTLYAQLGNVVESNKNVTSDEVKAFNQYLSGLKKLLSARAKELKGAATESYDDIEDPDLRAALEALDAELAELDDDESAMEGCGKKCKKTTEGCKKAAESDDEDCDPDDNECDPDDEDEDSEDDDDDDEEDDDDAEEACGESFTSSELDEFADACESMMNDDFDMGDEPVEESSGSNLLNSDGTLKF